MPFTNGVSARNTVSGRERRNKLSSQVLRFREQQTRELYFLETGSPCEPSPGWAQPQGMPLGLGGRSLCRSAPDSAAAAPGLSQAYFHLTRSLFWEVGLLPTPQRVTNGQTNRREERTQENKIAVLIIVIMSFVHGA